MDWDQSLNIAYILQRVYELISSIFINPEQVPDLVVVFVEWVAILGVVSSVILLTLIVYTRIRMLQVEHHGFHVREEAERAKREIAIQRVKNPRWEAATALASSPNESDWRRAILEADSMLAALLTERGYAGTTLGEQLKGASREQFTTLNLAWEAHRMRNTLAHLGEAFPLSERDAHTTMDQFRRVFEEFGYI